MYREVDEMPKCANCGILVPCCEVHAARHGADLTFCSERCITIYDEYTFPKYREKILAAHGPEEGVSHDGPDGS